jgi:hypothetical protein
MKNGNATSGCRMRLTVLNAEQNAQTIATMNAPMTRDEGKLRG